MALQSPKFDRYKIILRDLTCSECSVEASCDKTNVITPEKNKHLDMTDIENRLQK